MVTFLLIAVAAVPSSPLPDRFERPQVEALAAAVVREFETGYVSPAAAGKAVPALRAKWSATDFLAIRDPRQLLERMNADLGQALHDKHLRLMPVAMLPPGAFDPESKEAPPEVKKFLSRRHWNIPRVEVLPGNVGVVKLDGFAPDVPESRQAIAEAMAFVKDTEALIVDLRDNHGGEGDTVAEVISYLVDARSHLVDEVDREGKVVSQSFTREKVTGPRYGAARPVYVLISPRTFSAGEECAFDLFNLKRAKLVGETTGGGGNHNRFVKLTEDVALSLPYSTVRSPVTGKGWEGVGVPPDVRVASADALRTAHKLAVTQELASEPDARRRAALQRLLAEM